MKKYDEYKDSGVAWIGEVPKHWEVIKTSLAFQGIGSGTTPSTSKKEYYDDNGNGKYWLQTGDLEDGIVYDTSKKVSNIAIKECNLTFYPIDSIIIAMYGATIGKVGILGIESATNQACCVIPVTKKQIAKYFFYEFLACKPALLIAAIGGGQPNISQDTIKKLKIVIPPINEQTAIATYLDTHCAKIDNLISIQQKRIALLQELKQSVITHAVTKGLNPNVEMKQSGVEWIGDVPKHWEVMPIKYIADTNSGATPKNIKGRQNERSDIKWVRTTDLSDICDYVYDSSEYLSREEMKSASCPWLPKNTVVVAMYGGSGTIGKAGILGCDSTINQALCSLETKKLEDYRYLYYNIKSLRPYWMKLAASSRKDPNISQEIIRNMDVPVPGIDEQTKIVQYLDRKCTTINTSISNAQHQIELLQEYKQSLITEVVTGKRKVTDN